MKQKKKNRYNSTRNVSLKKEYNTKIRQEYIDLDYLNKLDDTKKTCKLPDGSMVTELEYMGVFMKEWNSGGVGKQKEAKNNKIHRTAKEVKNCTDRTNERNRDQYGIARAQHLIHTYDNETLAEFIDQGNKYSTNDIEDAIIDLLDQMKKASNSGSNTDD